MPGVRIDGNDVLAVYSAVSGGRDAARRARAPRFIEAVTYRVGAHSTSDDPSRYRAQEEVDAWLARDPVQTVRRHLVKTGQLDDADDKALEDALNAEIAEAIQIAEAYPPPPRSSIFDDVYAAVPRHLEEQRDELMKHPPAPGHGE
jgi:pyruvate dehydrogenase E1 component alpha subunit